MFSSDSRPAPGGGRRSPRDAASGLEHWILSESRGGIAKKHLRLQDIRGGVKEAGQQHGRRTPCWPGPSGAAPRPGRGVTTQAPNGTTKTPWGRHRMVPLSGAARNASRGVPETPGPLAGASSTTPRAAGEGLRLGPTAKDLEAGARPGARCRGTRARATDPLQRLGGFDRPAEHSRQLGDTVPGVERGGCLVREPLVEREHLRAAPLALEPSGPGPARRRHSSGGASAPGRDWQEGASPTATAPATARARALASTIAHRTPAPRTARAAGPGAPGSGP